MALPTPRWSKRFWILLAGCLLLSLADLFLTWKLVRDGEQAMESNPVANWWLGNYGWGGLTAFKLCMFAVIGAMSGRIAFHRPVTGEMILVFSCGALAAVLMNSMLLVRLAAQQVPDLRTEGLWYPATGASAPRAYPIGYLPDNPLLLLLCEEPIQKEVELTAPILGAVETVANRRKEIHLNPSRLKPDEWRIQAEEFLTQENTLMHALDPKQTERLWQIYWQQRGLYAFADPEVIEALRLTPQQNVAVSLILEDLLNGQRRFFRSHRFGYDALRRPRTDTTQSMGQLLAVLDEHQAAIWKTFIGEPFRGNLTVTSGPTGIHEGAARHAVRQWR